MKTVVLDVETIPDECAMTRCRYVMDDEFAPWPLHELACASVLIINKRSRIWTLACKASRRGA